GDREVEVGDAGDEDQRRQHDAGALRRLTCGCRFARRLCDALHGRAYISSQAPLGPRLWSGVPPASLLQPQASWMWPKTARRGRCSSIAASSAGLPKPPSGPSQWPFGGECRTSTAPSGQGASIATASSSERSKLHSQGVVGTPAPSPKYSIPSIVVPSPCRTVAALPPAAAARSASAVSLLPGTSTVGFSIPARTAIVSSSPSW